MATLAPAVSEAMMLRKTPLAAARMLQTKHSLNGAIAAAAALRAKPTVPSTAPRRIGPALEIMEAWTRSMLLDTSMPLRKSTKIRLSSYWSTTMMVRPRPLSSRPCYPLLRKIQLFILLRFTTRLWSLTKPPRLPFSSTKTKATSLPI
ncbi:hypothetical protein S40288_11727 [Stachybotrys chartarum IBT 40288]|nr:hypothetical protein S40288_11727 [Stachybotrys chartarum IBT 40288]